MMVPTEHEDGVCTVDVLPNPHVCVCVCVCVGGGGGGGTFETQLIDS